MNQVNKCIPSKSTGESGLWVELTASMYRRTEYIKHWDSFCRMIGLLIQELHVLLPPRSNLLYLGDRASPRPRLIISGETIDNPANVLGECEAETPSRIWSRRIVFGFSNIVCLSSVSAGTGISWTSSEGLCTLAPWWEMSERQCTASWS